MTSDIERGPPNVERVVLRINGLTCGCCEGGLSRILSRIPAIKDFQVNRVLARVEFNLDTNRLSVTDVIKTLSSKTGYNFEHYVPLAGSVLDLIVSDPAQFKLSGQPFGIIRVDMQGPCWNPRKLWSRRSSVIPPGTVLTSKDDPDQIRTEGTSSEEDRESKTKRRTRICLSEQPTRVYYDARKIGARDVFEYYHKFCPTLRLATQAVPASPSACPVKKALWRLFPAVLFTIPVVVLAWAPIDHSREIYTHVSLLFATLVQFVAVHEFVLSAWRKLSCCVLEADVLLACVTGVAYILSLVYYLYKLNGSTLLMGPFFEATTMIVSSILLGRLIIEVVRHWAAKTTSFRSLQIDKALLVVSQGTGGPYVSNAPGGPRTTKIDARLLQYGDEFVVPPHTKVVTDGVILYGGSEIDESMVTGETIPVAKGKKSTVYTGTLNGSGELHVKLTALLHENSVRKIATMVEDTELTKPIIQALADLLAKWFVLATAMTGLVVFVLWVCVERLHYKHDWKNASSTAITYAIATLIVTCPCAIVLAVPIALLFASSVAARFGIIFRSPQKLDIARKVTDVVFDKTGILTTGYLTIVDEQYLGVIDVERVKGLLLGLLKNVKHPVSAGVFRHLEREVNLDFDTDIKTLEVLDIVSVPGEGIQGTCSTTNEEIRAGNPDWLNIQTGPVASTLFCVSISGKHCATFTLWDQPRYTAGLVVSKLLARGIAVHMVSGDSQGAVDATAHELDVPKKNTKARCRAKGKSTYIRDLQRPGKVVMFVGDGADDALAIGQADVGVHFSTGTEVLRTVADVVLTTTRLHYLLILIDISRAAFRRIVLSFAWVTIYNMFAVPLAAGAFVGYKSQMKIEPRFAGLGELVSVLPVVLLACSLRWRDFGKKYRAIEYDYLKSEPPVRGSSDHGKERSEASLEDAQCGFFRTSKKTVARWTDCSGEKA